MQITGTLVVNGDSEFSFVRIKKDLEVNGKIISKGEQPKIEILSSEPDASAFDVTAEVTGTDVAGVIKMTTRTRTQSDLRLKLTFSKPFTSAPSVVLAALGRDSALTGMYIESIDDATVIVNFLQLPDNGKSVQFNYQVIQGVAAQPVQH
jgi:hypothetical protein